MSAMPVASSILRAAAVCGQPVGVGAVPRRPELPSPARDAAAAIEDQRRQGYADGFATGREAGHEQGHAEGLQAGRADAAELVKVELGKACDELRVRAAQERGRIDALASALVDARREMAAQAEDALAGLALELGCKVLGPALVSAEGVRAQAGHLVAGLREPVALRVSPALVAELAALPTQGVVEWIADDSVHGGVVLERGNGEQLDARLDTILANFKTLLLQSRACVPAARVEDAA